jgi:hypothetical protein
MLIQLEAVVEETQALMKKYNEQAHDVDLSMDIPQQLKRWQHARILQHCYTYWCTRCTRSSGRD